MESFPLPSAWSFSVVCGFLSRAVGGRRVGVASASPESDSGGARDAAHRYVPRHCPGCTWNLSGSHSALLIPQKSFH